MEESAKVDLSEKALRKLTAGMISNIEAAPTLDEMVRDGKTAWGMPNQNMGLILQDQPDDSTPTPKPTEKPVRKIGRTAQAEKVKSGHAKSCGDKQDKRQPKRKSPRNHGAEQNDQSKNHGACHDQTKTFLEIILGIHNYDSLKKSSSITTFRTRYRNSAIRAISRSYGSESP